MIYILSPKRIRKFFPGHYTFKVDENSRTFQGLAQINLRTFQGLPLKFKDLFHGHLKFKSLAMLVKSPLITSCQLGFFTLSCSTVHLLGFSGSFFCYSSEKLCAIPL